MLTKVVLSFSLIGAGLGYLLAGLVPLGTVASQFVTLQLYIVAMAVPWIVTILVLNSTYGNDLPLDRHDSLKQILRNAPLWSKVLASIALAISVLALLALVVSGGSLQVASWSDAPPHTKAVFFLTVAAMYCLPVPLVAAIRSHVLKRRDERG